MQPEASNLFPTDALLLSRQERQRLTRQRARVIWLYGLSGSGKSTLANGLDRRLHGEGRISYVLDGDNVRTGLNRGLGFSDQDRYENIRRIAEVSKLFVQAGVIVINAFITPQRWLRDLAREIIGAEDLIEIFVSCPFEVCAQRDVKGLYAKAAQGGVPLFTGKDSVFEEPENAVLTLHTDREPLETSLGRLYDAVKEKVSLPS